MALLGVSISKTPSQSTQALSLSKGWPSLAGRGRSVRLPLQNKTSALPIVCLRGANTSNTKQDSSEAEASVMFSRRNFPHGFTFGAASSAYQIEGAWNEGGKGPSIWDTYTHTHPEKIADGSNGDVAVDSYHRYKEDVKLLKDMGLDAYRFSVSWPRILPKGSLKGGINQEGIKYYNDLIDELLKNGIQPYVTLFHWDVPQALEDEYGGFLSEKIADDFKDYCEVCYKAFGDRVKHWITLNEPWTFSSMGYGLGSHAPGRCSKILGCSVGDSITEPYIVTHNLIIAHAKAAKLYKEKYQATQGGEIGITLVCMWYAPYAELHQHYEAQQRSLDFMLAWYMEPLVHGDYPFNMKAIVRDRLPNFTEEESKLIQGSYDFIGINYYTARYARSVQFSHDVPPFLSINEAYTEQLEAKDGVPIGDTNGSWIYVYPKGIKDLLVYIKRRYDNPAVYITENGISEVDKTKSNTEEALDDQHRASYLKLHLAEIREAMRDGANVKGYFAWSLTDNFEWDKGYTERFGLTYMDYEDNLKRIPKGSSKWFADFLKAPRHHK